MGGLNEPIQIAESPWRQSEGSNTEESVEDLAVDLQPLLARRRVVVGARVVHGRGSFEKEEEQHGLKVNG